MLAKSVIFDVADNYGAAYAGLRSIEFKSGGTVISLTASDFTTYTTTSPLNASADSDFAFVTSLSKTGGWQNTSWMSTSATNERLIIVFDTSQNFDGITINNFHANGGTTTYGSKNIEIYATESTVTDTTYGAAVTGGTKIFDGTLSAHILSDTADDQDLTLDLPAGDTEITSPEVVVTASGTSSIKVIHKYRVSVPEVIVTTSFSAGINLPIYNKIYSPEVVLLTNFFSTVRSVTNVISPEVELNVDFDCSVTSYSLKDTAHYYYFTLTGAEDGLSDIDIPIENFQCRRRSGAPTYLSVTIPSYDNVEAIAARPNGKLRVDIVYKRYGEIVQRRKLVQTNFDGLMSHQGTKSSSIMLQGYVTETYVPKTLDIDTSMYRSVNLGIIRHRLAKPIPSLNPGDTVNIGTDTFVANVISFYIAPHSQTMEVAEE